MCVHVSGASHAARRCAKVEINPHALYVCNEAAASRSIADATYCVLRDGLAWQLQSSVQTLSSSLHKVLNEHVEGECLEIILILEIEQRRQRLLWQSSLLLFVRTGMVRVLSASRCVLLLLNRGEKRSLRKKKNMRCSRRFYVDYEY